MEPLQGLWFHTIERHALPALIDGFIREYKKEWLESFSKHLQRYDIWYKDYCEKKAAGTLGETHLKPLSEMFTEDELRKIPVDNKAGENYFGHFSQQLKAKGGSAFQAISDRLVLKSSADIAFGKGAESMLKDKVLKSRQKDVAEIEADYSRAQKDLMRSKLALTDPEADKLAREQSKTKAMALCRDNGKKHKYDAPLTSQDEVHKCYNQIKMLKEQDKLAILRREIKLKKIMFSELPSDFVYFKQYNISSKQMYENLLALHSVDQCNQEVITVEDVYEATDLLDSPAAQSQTKRKKSAAPTSAEPELDFQWPLEEEEFVITLEEDGWNLGSVQSYNQEQDTICVQALTTLKTCAKDDVGKTY